MYQIESILRILAACENPNTGSVGIPILDTRRLSAKPVRTQQLNAVSTLSCSAGPNMIFGHLSGHISRGAPSPKAKLPTSLEGVERALPTDFGLGARSATRDMALEVP